MTDILDGVGEYEPLDLEPIKARKQAYLAGGWNYYPPTEAGWLDFVPVARAFYAEAVRDIPALIAEVEYLRAAAEFDRETRDTPTECGACGTTLLGCPNCGPARKP